MFDVWPAECFVLCVDADFWPGVLSFCSDVSLFLHQTICQLQSALSKGEAAIQANCYHYY